MKFYNYLNENLKEDMTIDEINDLLRKDCQYYFNLIKEKYLFSRGMKSHSDSFGLKKVRQDRKPRGTNKEIFPLFNDGLEENNHLRRDKSVIAANILAKKTFSMFGSVYYIFPIGKFNYTGIKADDVNMDDNRTGGQDDSVKLMFDNGIDGTTHGFDTYFTTNKDIEKAYKNKYEIGFDCKKYYYFSHGMFEYTGRSNKLRLGLIHKYGK